MKPSFNLIEEPWIPCIMLDGTYCSLGIVDVFRQAPQIREIYHDVPFVTIGIQRLLLAILFQAVPKTLKKWEELWRGAAFPNVGIDRYLRKHTASFDLFDPKHPFFQDMTLKVAKKTTTDKKGKKEEKDKVLAPAQRIVMHYSSGSNATLFDHRVDDRPVSLTPAEAARFLVAYQSVIVGGGKSATGYRTDAPLANYAVVLVVGHNLFQTLMLNLVPENQRSLADQKGAKPVWENSGRYGKVPGSYSELLVWPSRAIRLIPTVENQQIVVRKLLDAQGRAIDSKTYIDPMARYSGTDKKQGWRLQLNRDLWRDSLALFQLRSAQKSEEQRPAAIDFLAGLIDRGTLPSDLACTYHVFGLITGKNKAEIRMWRQERLPLPLSILQNKEAAADIRDALDHAEVIGRALYEAFRRLVKYGVVSTERTFWRKLERPFYTYVRTAARTIELEAHSKLLDDWKRTCVEIAKEAFADGLTYKSGSSQLFKARAEAENKLFMLLAKSLTTVKE